jgi:uncharacterized protein YdeI (YjbR/CyaY-like superfamily)
MKVLEQIFFKDQTAFRSWLKKNHQKSPGIWLVFYKKHIKKESLYYKEALDVALCFGWIDSTVKRIDDEKYMQMFTPRSNTKNWSDVNKKKVNELIGKGLMTEAGLKKIDLYLKTGKVDWEIKEREVKEKRELIIPKHILNEFARNKPALGNFNALIPSLKRYYIEWITSAKKDETISRRLKETIAFLKENKKLGLK